MSMRDDVFRKALDLGPDDRAELARRLMQSFGLEEPEDGDDEPGANDDERAWEAELMRRLDDYDSGRVKGVDGFEMLRRAREEMEEQIRERKRKKRLH